MKNKLKKFFSNAKVFIKKNALSCLCLLLATLVAITGSVSYSKYISSSPITEGPGAGSFSASATIDGVSALSFTNTAFWGGTVEEDKIAMNALRSVDFHVRNYEYDGSGNKKIADVKMKYNLVFDAPKNFAERLAIQVFDEANQPLLPQIVLSYLIDSVASSTTGVYDTGKTPDYNASKIHDEVFDVVKSGDTFTATMRDNENTVIIVEDHFEDVHQRLDFRTWDCSALTNTINPTLNVEGGTLTPPLTVNYMEENVEFYRIIIKMPQFILEPGAEREAHYSIRIAPTDTIQDGHLGGSFVQLIDGKYVPVKEIYGGSSNDWYLENIHEKVNDKFYSDENFTEPIQVNGNNKVEETEYNIMGSRTIYNPGETIETVAYTLQSKTQEDFNEAFVPVTETVTGTKPEALGLPTKAQWDTVTTMNENMNSATPTNEDTDSATPTWNDNINGNGNNSYYEANINGGKRRVYVYSFPCTKTYTQTGEYTVVEKRERKKSEIVTTTNDIEESGNVISVSDGERETKIHLQRTTKTTVETDAVTEIETVTTVYKYSRTITLSGTFSKAFYNNNYRNSNTNDQRPTSNQNAVEYDEVNSVTLRGNGGTYYLRQPSWNDADTAQAGAATITDSSSSDPVYEEVTTPSIVKYDPVTEHVDRTITRSFNHTKIKIEKLIWDGVGADGFDPDDFDANGEEYNEFTEAHPLKLYLSEYGLNDGGGMHSVDVQKIYLAQCYSKNYPFYVNVIFEQYLD